MSQDVRSFSLALSALNQSIKKRDEARDNCKSSWGYYGAEIEREVIEAEDRFLREFNDMVDERIKQVIKESK